MPDYFKIHPTFTRASDLQDICKPLLDYCDIEYFAYVHVDTDQQFSQLCLNAPFAKAYLDKQYHHYDVNVKNSTSDEEYILWDAIERQAGTQDLYDLGIAHGTAHTFSLVQSTGEGKDIFHFGAKPGCTKINEFYLQNIDMLKRFARYFKEKIYADKHLSRAIEMKIATNLEMAQFNGANIENNTAFKDKFIQETKLKRYFRKAGERKQYCTPREVECLYWLSQGKTAVETAIILGISERMIKEHIKNMKQKLGCDTLFQLGLAFAEMADQII